MKTPHGLPKREVLRLISLESDECQIWPFSCFPDGYPKIWFDGKHRRVNRHVFEVIHGYLPEVVRHTCDEPRCCNPKHFLPGTHVDNSRDRFERGRQAKGEQHGRSKLTAIEVQQIRSLHVKRSKEFGSAALANRFGVSRTQIDAIVRGLRWASTFNAEVTEPQPTE